jgi:hypothetical protein
VFVAVLLFVAFFPEPAAKVAEAIVAGVLNALLGLVGGGHGG